MYVIKTCTEKGSCPMDVHDGMDRTVVETLAGCPVDVHGTGGMDGW